LSTRDQYKKANQW